MKIIPYIVGMVLILTGTTLALIRTIGSIHTEGIITDVAKMQKRQAKVTVEREAPVVKYNINGREYSGISDKFFTEGIIVFKKGKSIKIRVSKFDKRRFVPEESGGIAEKLLIFGGIFISIANFVILWRYG